MRNKTTRRVFLAALAAPFVSRLDAQAQGSLILRNRIEGDARYVAYASDGPYYKPTAPLIFNGEISPTYIFFPYGVKRAQLIVFSHGALMDPLSYRDLIWHWVSHGFVVIAPLHDDAVIMNGPSLRKRTDDNLSEWPIPMLLEDVSAWRKRIAACRSALDLAGPLLKQTNVEIDMTRPIIAGHGYGAFIANLLMGAKVQGPDQQALDLADSRFFSSISLSPQGPGVMGLTDDSWAHIGSPMLGLVAEHETDFTGQPWQTKGQSFKLSKPGYKHFGMLKDGNAHSFTGQMAGGDPHQGKLFEVLKAYTTAFLKAYGEYNPVAFEDLTTNYFQRNSLGALQEYKR